MAFLTGILASVLEWILAKILTIVGQDIALYEEDQKIKAQALKDKTEAQNAVTPDESFKSATDTAHDTFN